MGKIYVGLLIGITTLVLCSKTPEIMDYNEVDTKPTPINLVEPAYPESAKNEGVQGQTIVKALIEADGSIETAEISSSSGNELLDNAALTAVLVSSFKPAPHKGQSVKVWVNIPIKFILKDK